MLPGWKVMCHRLFALFVFLLALVVPSIARADRPPRVATIVDARAAMLSGDYPLARAILEATAAAEDSPEYAAAAKQLLVILDDWERKGRPLSPRGPAPEVEPDDDFHLKLRIAVVLLEEGWYSRAGVVLDDLIANAPDATWRIVAQQLRLLSLEARSTAIEAPRVTREEPPPVITTRWYGWQNLIVDGLSALTVKADCIGCIGYFVGSPIVHAAHGRWDAAGASAGLRLGAPFVVRTLLMMGRILPPCSQCEAHDLGMGIGALTAVVIDDVAFAQEKVRGEEKRSQVAPSIAARKDGGIDLGVSGVF